MNHEQRIQYLYSRHVEGQATRPELAELFALADEPEHQPVFEQLFSGSWDELYAAGQQLDQAASDDTINPVVHRVHFLKTGWFRYAAVLLLIAGTATWLYYSPSFRRNPGVTKQQQATQPPDIQPGTNRATLTLSDGRVIVLDSAANGSLASEGGTQVTKQDAGMLVYQAPQGTFRMTDKKIAYHTIRTPRGGQYQILLPDGSTAWLNAASSIQFPTAFLKERNIRITGEVFLDIAPDKNKPFTVTVNGATINVLGTSFNVNAYADEPLLNTTLINGSVQIMHGTQSAILKAGQQAGIGRDSAIRVLKEVNIDKIIAWKTGVFDFAGSDMAEAMRQLSRWYNIDVVYEQGIPDIKFGGRLSKNVKLSSLLKGLEEFGIHFRMEEGRRLVVLP